MSKHTPGPWTDDTQEHDCPYQDITIKAGSRGICRIWMDDAPVHDFNSEQDANARLIAAAPDLLEAAQETMRLLELLSILAQDGKEIYKHELRGDIELFTKRIAPAIAKATKC